MVTVAYLLVVANFCLLNGNITVTKTNLEQRKDNFFLERFNIHFFTMKQEMIGYIFTIYN